jgi:hypothetical protein
MENTKIVDQALRFGGPNPRWWVRCLTLSLRAKCGLDRTLLGSMFGLTSESLFGCSSGEVDTRRSMEQPDSVGEFGRLD